RTRRWQGTLPRRAGLLPTGRREGVGGLGGHPDQKTGLWVRGVRLASLLGHGAALPPRGGAAPAPGLKETSDELTSGLAGGSRPPPTTSVRRTRSDTPAWHEQENEPPQAGRVLPAAVPGVRGLLRRGTLPLGAAKPPSRLQPGLQEVVPGVPPAD